MKHNKTYSYIFLILLAMLVKTGSAEVLTGGDQGLGQELEVIDLFNRPASDLIPVLKPMVEQGGSLTGEGFKIIIKASPKNIAQVKKMIEELDVAQRRLYIHVSTDRKAIEAIREAQARARIKKDNITVTSPGKVGEDGSIVIDSGTSETSVEVEAKVYSTDTRSLEPQAQTIMVNEGQWAVIRTGTAQPVMETRQNADGTVTQTVRYQSVASYVKVKPEVRGNNVILSIEPQRSQMSPQGGGVIDESGLSTTVATHIGEWVELGGTYQHSQSSTNSTTYSTQRQSTEGMGIFVKVEIK